MQKYIRQRQGQLLLIKIKSLFCQSMVKVGHCVTHTLYGRYRLLKAKKKKNGVKIILIYFQPKKQNPPQKYLLI